MIRLSAPAANRERGVLLASWTALALCAAVPAAGGQQIPETADLIRSGGRRLTLSEAIEIAQQENPSVRSAVFRFAATRAGVWEAYGNFLPRLDLSGSLQKSGRGEFLIGGITFPVGERFTTYYQFDVTHRLLDAGRDLFRLEGARAERRAAGAQVTLDRLRTATAVTRAYVSALAATGLRDQAEREIGRRRSRLDVARARFELGSVTRTDVLQAQIGLSQAEVDAISAGNQIRTAKLELLRAMGVEADPDSVELVQRLKVFEPSFDVDSLVGLALGEHPRLRQLRDVREQREDENWIAKTSYLPTLQAAASFSRSASDSSAFVFEDFDSGSLYSVSLTWELFGGFSRLNQTSRSRAELRAAEEAVRSAELEIEAAVRRFSLDLLTLYLTHETRAENVELARQQLELAQERYRIGALSFPDLQDAEVTFSAAETDYIRSSYDFFLTLADLEEASGRSLFPTAAAARPAP